MATFSRSAQLHWEGETTTGDGVVSASSGAFTARATFPKSLGDPPKTTTPEELLAAAHAVCFGIGLRSMIARRGGRARALTVTATVTADKGRRGITIVASHLDARIDGLEGLDPAQLDQVALETKERCTISIAIGSSVAVTHHVAVE